MRILHTADWHLGKRLEHISRLEEQKAVLNEICEIAEREQIDVVLIAGDLFDHANPSIEAIELFYKNLKRLADNGKRAVIGIAGNHDSPDRIEVPNPLARECGIILLGYPETKLKPFELDSGLKITQSDKGFVELQLPNQAFPLRLILTPYANELRLKKFLGIEEATENLRNLLQEHWQYLADTYCDEAGINLLMTHLFVLKKGQSNEDLEDEGEKSILTIGGAPEIFTEQFPTQLQYAALGHLHGYIEVQKEPYPIIYSSSPLCYSVKDRRKEKYVVIIDAAPGKSVAYKRLPLTEGKIALQKSFSDIEEALIWLSENQETLVELRIQTDEHINAQDRKRLLDAHAGILRIIPQFSNPDLLRFTSGKNIDLTKGMEELFTDYFFHKKGQQPNEEILDIFREVLGEDTSQSP